MLKNLSNISPAVGDTSNLWLWIAIGGGAVLIAAFLIIRKIIKK